MTSCTAQLALEPTPRFDVILPRRGSAPALGRQDSEEDDIMMASVVPLLLVIASIVALGVTGNLFVLSPLVIAVQVAAIGLAIWARRSFQKGTFRVTASPGGSSIIRTGPYGFVRHPMYAAALLFIWAAVVSHVSVFTLAVGFAVSGIAIARVVVEERLLRARYSDYQDYARSTRALVPYVF